MSIAIVPPSCSMCYPSSSIFVYLSRFQLLTGQDKPHNNTMEKDSTSHSLPHGNTCLTTADKITTSLMEYNGPWSHQQFNFQEDATAKHVMTTIYLSTTSLYVNNKRDSIVMGNSISRNITMEIEFARSTNLGKQITNIITQKEYGLGKLGLRLEHHLLHPHLTVLDSLRILNLELSLQLISGNLIQI